MNPSGVSRTRSIVTAVAVLAAVVLIVGATVFAAKKKQTGDTADADSTTTTTASGTGSTETGSSPAPSSTSTGGYKDGSYSADSSYESPGGTEGITVQLTIRGGVVTDSTVATDPTGHEAREYQSKFTSNYKDFVIGKPIDSILLSRVSGSSLTSQGFNSALTDIKAQAQV